MTTLSVGSQDICGCILSRAQFSNLIHQSIPMLVQILLESEAIEEVKVKGTYGKSSLEWTNGDKGGVEL